MIDLTPLSDDAVWALNGMLAQHLLDPLRETPGWCVVSAKAWVSMGRQVGGPAPYEELVAAKLAVREGPLVSAGNMCYGLALDVPPKIDLAALFNRLRQIRESRRDARAVVATKLAEARAAERGEPRAKKASAAKEATDEAATKEPKASKPSAASRFRELILAGTLEDDEIFKKVQAEFDLDDSRRSYVDWYRKDLKKKGLLPA